MTRMYTKKQLNEMDFCEWENLMIRLSDQEEIIEKCEEMIKATQVTNLWRTADYNQQLTEKHLIRVSKKCDRCGVPIPAFRRFHIRGVMYRVVDQKSVVYQDVQCWCADCHDTFETGSQHCVNENRSRD